MGKLADQISYGLPIPGRSISKKRIGTYSVEESVDGYRIIAYAEQYYETFRELGKQFDRYVLSGTAAVFTRRKKLVASGDVVNYKPRQFKGHPNPLYIELFDYEGETAKTDEEKKYCIKEVAAGLKEQRRHKQGAIALLTQRLPRGAP